eukprot:TRINITY_DN3808_c0_g1_i2.p1 TRINITY_DN3808_c0_g1~~TRINITY_DN3808_c0_g1_i2.p1  ORF type:complete len:131 (-),score=24.14 TRINITY_DN3808_c0_g1_i2:26-418(-)
MLDIFDTAGQDEYSATRDGYYKQGEGFILVYSVTSRVSFEDIDAFVNTLLRVKDVDKTPLVLVGNKCDCADREVSREEGERFAKSLGAKFLESSAKKKVNVKEIYTVMVKEILLERKSKGDQLQLPEKRV